MRIVEKEAEIVRVRSSICSPELAAALQEHLKAEVTTTVQATI
jgi:hypothetical protein